MTACGGASIRNAITAARPAAGAICERVAEEALTRRFGVHVRTRPDGKAREIVGDHRGGARPVLAPGGGPSPQASRSWPLRTKRSTARRRAPYVLRLMAEHVTLKTRAPKPEQTPPREQLLDGWERAIRERLGRSFDDVLQAVAINPERELRAEPIDAEKVIKQAIADVEAHQGGVEPPRPRGRDHPASAGRARWPERRCRCGPSSTSSPTGR